MGVQTNLQFVRIFFEHGFYVIIKETENRGNLALKYNGPNSVVKWTATGSYIQRNTTKEILNRNFAPEQLKRVTQSLDHDDEFYELESIVDHKLTPMGEMIYTVKWKGYSDQTDLVYKDFISDLIIREYWKKKGLAYPHKIKSRQESRESKETRSKNWESDAKANCPFVIQETQHLQGWT